MGAAVRADSLVRMPCDSLLLASSALHSTCDRVSNVTLALLQYEQVVLLDHDWIPECCYKDEPELAFLEEWHANMTQALAPLANPLDALHGIFNPACFIHTAFSHTKPLIGGASYFTAMNLWYHKIGSPANYKLADDCGVLCNPTC